MIRKQKETKGMLSRKLGISRASLYYTSKQLQKDWELKHRIERVLADNPSYGFRRVAIHLNINKKRAQRVMKIFSIRAYRRRGKRYRKPREIESLFPNLLFTDYPRYPNHIWASDFTALPWRGPFIYLATIIDLFTREIIGWSLMTNHALPLILQAFFMALQ